MPEELKNKENEKEKTPNQENQGQDSSKIIDAQKIDKDNKNKEEESKDDKSKSTEVKDGDNESNKIVVANAIIEALKEESKTLKESLEKSSNSSKEKDNQIKTLTDELTELREYKVQQEYRSSISKASRKYGVPVSVIEKTRLTDIQDIEDFAKTLQSSYDKKNKEDKTQGIFFGTIGGGNDDNDYNPLDKYF